MKIKKLRRPCRRCDKPFYPSGRGSRICEKCCLPKIKKTYNKSIIKLIR
jgi:hypothetical protein